MYKEKDEQQLIARVARGMKTGFGGGRGRGATTSQP